MAQNRQKQRNQLIRGALGAARQRIDAAPTASDAFAPIGELVFWIIATDEGLRKQYRQAYTRWRDNHQHGHLFPAIRYARNKVAHESEAWDYGEEAIPLDEYADSYRYTRWVWVQLPRPGKAPNKKVEQTWRRQFAAYKQHLSGKPVIVTTMEAVAVLEEWWQQHGI